VRIERATDAFLDWRRIERDATPRSIESYRRILDKLAEDYPELDLPRFTKHDLRAFLKRWENRSSATRANVVSVLHSFFGWAVAEDLIEIDPSAPLRRPKKRRADIYRPSVDELAAVRTAALPHELPAILLMEGAGLRRAEVLHVRWADVDLIRGRVRVFRKGANWQPVPLAPDVLAGLRASFRLLQPELDDYLFTVEVEQWISQYERKRERKDPKVPASEQSLLAHGSACMQARGHPRTLAASTASRLRKSLPTRKRPRRRGAEAAHGPLADRHDAGVYGRDRARRAC
jgi:site-specific recombinase XerC